MWTAVVAPPGSRKTPGLEAAQQPLKRIQLQMQAEHEPVKSRSRNGNRAPTDEGRTHIGVRLGVPPRAMARSRATLPNEHGPPPLGPKS